MNINKKIILLIFISIILLIVGSLLFIISNKNKKIYCELEKKNYKSQINLNLDESIKINYDYVFESMDNAVDKYDEIKSYLKLIDNIDGVDTNINQEELKLNYFININLNKVSKKDYDLLDIKDLMNNNTKKDIINYYEKINYSCK